MPLDGQLLRRRIEPGDVARHRLLGYEGLVISLICEDDGYANVFVVGEKENVRRKVPLRFLEYCYAFGRTTS